MKRSRINLYHFAILGLVMLYSFAAQASIANKMVSWPQAGGGWSEITLAEAAIRQNIPQRPLSLAINYYDQNYQNFSNQRYITIIDYRIHSSKERLFLLDLETGHVLSEVVAHGRGSDPDHDGMANSFSNVEGSHASSLGFYQVSETYEGIHGYSVRLDGLSTMNSNARNRAIVIHGADYVIRGLDKMGRSFGCPAIPNEQVHNIIDKIKEGSLLFIYANQFESPARR